MKFKTILLYLTAFLLVMPACNENYLERLPIDAISTDDYWKTANDLKLYVNQFYTSFSDGDSWSGGIFWFDRGTDDMIYENYDTKIAGLRTVSVSGGWNYTKIRSVNFFLENYQKVEGIPSTYNQYVGEAYFFRAFFYYELVRTYGDVPWVEKTLQVDSEELYQARTSRKTVVENIIADLDKAIEYMKSGPNENGNRLNKEIALLLKSRVALYEGTWEKYHAGDPFGVSGSDGTTFLQQAATTAKQLIDSKVYSVYNTGKPKTSYWHLFNALTSYAGNPEVMFWKKYDAALGITHNHQRYLPVSAGRHGVTSNLINDYLCIDGAPTAGNPLYKGDASTLDVIANRDPRIYQTIYTPGWPKKIVGTDTLTVFIRSNLYSTGASKCPTGYQINKGAVTDPTQNSTADVGINPSIIFRYAEALLIYAEAKAELGTITQSDVDITINVLRDRVKMPHLNIGSIKTDPNWLFPNSSPLINEIRRERHVELAVEGYRWDDITRWKAHHIFVGKRPKGAKFSSKEYPELVIGKSVYVDENGYVDPYQVSLPNGYGFKPDRDYLAPIPTEQLTLNSKLVQNPGW